MIFKNITDQKVRKYFKSKYNNESLQSYAQSKIADLILDFGIACFSMYTMNMPLWANYSNNHKGVCLQFNTQIDKKFFTVLRPVYYQENLIEMEYRPIDAENEFEKIFFRKDRSWEYEKEIRLLKDFKGKLQFDKKALRNVILGYNAKPEYMKKVFQAIKENYSDVGIYKLEKTKKVGKLTYTEISSMPNST